MHERAARDDGETKVDGLPKSTLREFSRKLTFVPAGHRLSCWQAPRTLTRMTYLHINPQGPLLDQDFAFAQADIAPRLFFFDQNVWDTALKLKAQADSSDRGQRQYVEALSIVLMHELVRSERVTPVVRGGLATWQRKRVAEFIEGHLAEEISLADLAQLVNLSPYHFARAFKESFGVPPHRYHIARRMARAKDLLETPALSVTQIGIEIGFRETSSFSVAFRKFTGVTPSDFRRQFA